MSESFSTDIDDLPQTLPVFPLTGALLLPRARLPLNIFEPRYVAMIDDAMGAGRLIGMIQPQQENASGKNPPLYNVGCVGRIVSFAETDDRRYLVALQGVARFQVAEELPTTRGYRRIVPDWTKFANDVTDEEDVASNFSREKLITTLRPYFKVQGIMANWETIDELTPEKLVTAVATACPFSATEKQALLEAVDLKDRFDLLITLLQMASRSGPSNSTGNDAGDVRH